MEMLTIPWIVDNMILYRDEQTKPRQPSEIEIRARKSLQQLSVPDWYKNKCRESPKIISDRRPIESRPAPWKDAKSSRVRFDNFSRINVAPKEEGVTVMPVLGKTAKPYPSPEPEILNESVKFPSANSMMQISKTFPKMSPSRKIQNINLVFPTFAASEPEALIKDEMENSMESINSLAEFTPTKMSSLKDQEPYADVIENKKAFLAESPSLKSAEKIATLNFRSAGATTPVKLNHQEKKQGEKWLEDIEEVLTSSSIEYEQEDRRNDLYADESSAEIENRFFTSPRKSTEMEKIIKSYKLRSPGRSFVEEIIQELNAKCCDPRKVTSSYVSPSSNNFVKKLVEALEVREDKTEEKDRRPSISVKDLDSDSDSKASFLKEASPFRNFSKALQESSRGKLSREAVTPYVDDEDESVYWIPLPTCKLLRTSSLKNVTTSSCAPEVHKEPRFFSPPTFGYNGWGRTFDGRRIAGSRQLFRIDETTVFDSGYSERSGTNSSVSSLATDESWFYDDETTRTASEIGDISDNGGYLSYASIPDYQMQRSTRV